MNGPLPELKPKKQKKDIDPIQFIMKKDDYKEMKDDDDRGSSFI